MNIVETIQYEAEINQWPYPRIFEALKEAGIDSYIVKLGDQYQAIFEGTHGNWVQGEPKNYRSLKISEQFSSEGVKEALINHMQGRTNYVGFLEDIAKAGVSHYTVNMHTREIYYLNSSETLYHKEIVPVDS